MQRLSYRPGHCPHPFSDSFLSCPSFPEAIFVKGVSFSHEASLRSSGPGAFEVGQGSRKFISEVHFGWKRIKASALHLRLRKACTEWILWSTELQSSKHDGCTSLDDGSLLLLSRRLGIARCCPWLLDPGPFVCQPFCLSGLISFHFTQLHSDNIRFILIKEHFSRCSWKSWNVTVAAGDTLCRYMYHVVSMPEKMRMTW